ncbi:MAG: SMC-Scp complex subunit ScpB [Thermoanaerobaculia bacterium]
MSEKELRSALEAILFAAGEPVSLDSLVEAIADAPPNEVASQLDAIGTFFDEHELGFRLERTAGGWRFATRAQLDPYLKKFFSKQGEHRLSVAALETLAIVAYRQPITAPEISELRGVNSSGVIRTLLERKLVRIAGRKNVVGSPFLYRTTREFLIHFGLDSIQDLPRLEEFAEIIGENLTEELLGGTEDFIPTPEGELGAGSDAESPDEPGSDAGTESESELESGEADLQLREQSESPAPGEPAEETVIPPHEGEAPVTPEAVAEEAEEVEMAGISRGEGAADETAAPSEIPESELAEAMKQPPQETVLDEAPIAGDPLLESQPQEVDADDESRVETQTSGEHLAPETGSAEDHAEEGAEEVEFRRASDD